MKTYTIDSKRIGFISLEDELSKIKEDTAVIFLKKGIYFTDISKNDTLRIKIKNITICGEDGTVLYASKGHMINCFPKQGETSSLAHTLLFEDNQNIKLENIIMVNGCNIDFEYDGKVYPKKSEVITQAYAIGLWNVDYFYAKNCKFLSILDTFSSKNTKNLFMDDCEIMGNNDFIPIADASYFKNCNFKIFGPCPMYSAGKVQLIFDACSFFIETTGDTLYFTKRGGNLMLLACSFFTSLKYLQFEIKPKRTSRYYLYRNTWNQKPLPLKGIEETFINLTENEIKRINPLRHSYALSLIGEDQYSKEGILEIIGNANSISIEASTEIIITQDENRLYIQNTLIGKDKEGYVKIHQGFLEAVWYFIQIGEKQGYPMITKPFNAFIKDGLVYTEYTIEGEDDSYIEVFQESELLYVLNSGVYCFPVDFLDEGKSFVLKFHPKTTSSLEGETQVIVTSIIKNQDISNIIKYDNTSILQLQDEHHFHMKNIEAKYLGEEVPNVVFFTKGNDTCFLYSEGTDGALGKLGLIPICRGASLIYPYDQEVSTYEVNIHLWPEKKAGEGFGSANGQYLELWMNYTDGNGIAIRIEREISSNKGCYFSLREYRNWINQRISEKIFSNVFRNSVFITAMYCKNLLTFIVANEESEVSFTCPIQRLNGSFLLRHTGTVGVGNRFVIDSIKIKK